MKTLGYMPALDALRGIAIILVLGSHAGGLIPAGALGVDLFFALSGFLITGLLVTEWSGTGNVSLRAFYRRRALRLLPALILVLAAFSIVAFVYWDRGAVVATAALGLGYVMNFARGLAGPAPAPGLDHLWSLATEEQFYLLWPPLLVLALHRQVRPARLAIALVALAGLGASWRVTVALSGAGFERVWYLPDTHMDPILLGCAAGIAFSYGFVRAVPTAVLSLAVVTAASCVLVPHLEMSFALIGLPLFAAAATVLVLAGALGSRSWFVRAIDRAPLRYAGKISYGLYLWHWPLFTVFGWKAGLPLAILAAAGSYRYVEKPFLRRRYPSRSRDGHASSMSPGRRGLHASQPQTSLTA